MGSSRGHSLPDVPVNPLGSLAFAFKMTARTGCLLGLKLQKNHTHVDFLACKKRVCHGR